MPVWFWYTALIYCYSSTITARFPFPFVATIYKPSSLYLGFLTLPFSILTGPAYSFPLPIPPIYAYNMPIQLLYRPALHYVHLYRLCCPSNTLATLQIQMLRNVDMHWRWRKPQWHSVTFILISVRSGEPLTSSNVASNHVDVRPTSHRRAVSPAALFSAADGIFFSSIFVL